MYKFKSFNKEEIKACDSLIFVVPNPVECSDFTHLIGKRVAVDGALFMVSGVESFCHTAPWREGEKIGLMVGNKEITDAA